MTMEGNLTLHSSPLPPRLLCMADTTDLRRILIFSLVKHFVYLTKS